MMTATRPRGPVAILAAVLALLMGPSALAAILTVTDAGDTGAPGQLRTLIDSAMPGDTIVIPALTITLTGAAGDDANLSGDLDITKSLTIQGAGAGRTIIDGGGVDRVLEIRPGPEVTVAGVTIRSGAAVGGGGVSNFGTLTLVESVVTGNTASGDAGGIFNAGMLSIVDSTIAGNMATGAFGSGGGLENQGGGPVTILRSTISGNTAGFFGGGIRNGATMTVTDSTISGNASGWGGGGLANFDTLAIVNSTITENTAGSQGGGGLFNDGGDTATLGNTVLAGNMLAGSPSDCSGMLTSQGHNLIQTLSGGCTLSGDTTGNLIGVDPQLGPLARHGGRTRTHAPLPGSPAIDTGDDALCGPADQRGVTRPLDGDNDATVRCDIGAVEQILFLGGVELSLNQASYQPGDTLVLGVTAGNPGPAAPADLYVGFLLPPSPACPGGLPIAFLTAGLAGVALHCASDGPASFPRAQAGLLIPAGLPVTVVPGLLTAPIPPGVPPGTYTAFLALMVPNALVDDILDPGDVLAAGTTAFTIP